MYVPVPLVDLNFREYQQNMDHFTRQSDVSSGIIVRGYAHFS